MSKCAICGKENYEVSEEDNLIRGTLARRNICSWKCLCEYRAMERHCEDKCMGAGDCPIWSWWSCDYENTQMIRDCIAMKEE